MINVTDAAYGAVGDGITDDAAAIQAALDCGGWVYIPDRPYKLFTPLIVPPGRGLRLTMDPGAQLIRAGEHGMFFNGQGPDGPGGYGGRGNLLIEGGNWHLEGVGSDAYVTGIGIGHADNVVIRNATFWDVAGNHGIEVNGSRNVRIEDCAFKGFVAKPGDTVSREAIQIDGAFDSIGFGFGPYDDTVCDDVRISGCWVGDSGTPGTTAWPRAVGSHGALDTSRPRHKRIKVDHNTFVGTQDGAIRAWFWEEVIVEANTVAGSLGEGITVQRCQQIDVAGNQVTDSGRSGIWINDYNGNVAVHDNRVIGAGRSSDNAHFGIRVSGTCSVVGVVDNEVRKRSTGNNARYGLAITADCTQILRHGNDLRSSGVTGSLQDLSVSPVTAATDAG